MAVQSKTVVKTYFETGDRPTQTQFADLIDTALTISTDIDRNGFIMNPTLATRDLKYGFSYAYTPGTWTFTITDLGLGWAYYRNGVRCAITGNKSVVLNGGVTPASPTKFFIFIDATDGTLTSSTTPWTLEDSKILVALVTIGTGISVGGLAYLIADETHSNLIDRRIHKYLHNSFGTRWASGGLLTGFVVNDINGVVDTDNTFAVSAAVLYDEDIQLDLAAVADPNGATNAYAGVYRSAASVYFCGDIQVPFKYNLGTNAIQYDSGNGTQVDLTNNQYTNSYLFLTHVAGVPRFAVVQGRAVFTSLAQAQSENYSVYDWTGFPIAECVIAYQLTWRFGTAKGSKGRVSLVAAPKRVGTSFDVAGVAGLGDMSTQNSNAVNITGGLIALAALAQGGAVTNQIMTWNGSAWVPAAGAMDLWLTTASSKFFA